MKYFSFLLLLLLAFVNISSAKSPIKQRVLTIYSNEFFANDWMQTGNPIKRAFEFNCNCKVEFVILGNGRSALSRIISEGNKSPADLIMGLDESLIDAAKDSDLFDSINIDLSNLALPIKWSNPYFIPYDYGYLAFIYDSKKLKNPPKSFQELLDRNDLKIALQDPRSSATGSDFLIWINLIYQDNAVEALNKLQKNILKVTQSQKESYNLFTNNDVDMVLRYNTISAYHIMAENNYAIKAAQFTEGHYMRIELIGKLKHSNNQDLADKFIHFLLSKPCQRLIPTNNFMLPVIDIGSDMPIEYQHIFTPAKILVTKPNQLKQNHKLWIRKWLQALAKI